MQASWTAARSGSQHEPVGPRWDAPEQNWVQVRRQPSNTGYVLQLVCCSVAIPCKPGMGHLDMNSLLRQGRNTCSWQQMEINAQAARYDILQNLQHPHGGRFVF